MQITKDGVFLSNHFVEEEVDNPHIKEYRLVDPLNKRLKKEVKEMALLVQEICEIPLISKKLNYVNLKNDFWGVTNANYKIINKNNFTFFGEKKFSFCVGKQKVVTLKNENYGLSFEMSKCPFKIKLEVSEYLKDVVFFVNGKNITNIYTANENELKMGCFVEVYFKAQQTTFLREEDIIFKIESNFNTVDMNNMCLSEKKFFDLKDYVVKDGSFHGMFEETEEELNNIG